MSFAFYISGRCSKGLSLRDPILNYLKSQHDNLIAITSIIPSKTTFHNWLLPLIFLNKNFVYISYFNACLLCVSSIWLSLNRTSSKCWTVGIVELLYEVFVSFSTNASSLLDLKSLQNSVLILLKITMYITSLWQETKLQTNLKQKAHPKSYSLQLNMYVFYGGI